MKKNIIYIFIIIFLNKFIKVINIKSNIDIIKNK